MIQARSGPRRLLVVAGLVALLHALLLSVGREPGGRARHAGQHRPRRGRGAGRRRRTWSRSRSTNAVSLTDQGIRVFDAQGEPVSADATSADTVVTADLPDELDDGTYVVTYRVVSADGHPIAGSLTFSIGAPSETVVPPDVGDADPTRSMKAAVGIVQGLGYVGLLLAAGLVVFQCWMLGWRAGVARRPATCSPGSTWGRWGWPCWRGRPWCRWTAPTNRGSASTGR